MNTNQRQSPPNESEQEAESLRLALADLKAENERLKADNAQFRAIVGTQSKIAKWLANLGMRVYLGTNLIDSVYALIHAWRSKGWPPEREVANLIAALLRRWLRIGLIAMLGGAVAVITVLLLLWQNFLIQEQIQQQSQQQEQQSRLQGEQIQQQEKISNVARRAELISTIYNKIDCGKEYPDLACPPASSVRARAEAALAFAELERVEGKNPDLSSADLSGADLNGANLSTALLIRANLRVANLRVANLSGTDLSGTDLSGADLSDADLSDAILTGAKYTTSFYGTQWPEGFDPVAAGAILVDDQGQQLEPPSPTATP
jgi:uncharacterized protein YjbI with pentapeptide repeats